MVSPLIIEIDGNLITGRIDGTENFSVTIRRADEAGRLSKSFSSELTFYDDGYNYIKTNLIDDPNGFSKSVKVKVYDDCCREAVFEGIIKGDSLDWCEPGCYVTANLVEDESVVNCVRSTIIWDNFDGFLNKSQPVVRYCIEMRPNFIQYILIGLAFQLNLIFFSVLLAIIPAIFVIFGIIYLVCNLIATICRGISIRFRILGRTVTIRIGPFCDPPDCEDGFTNPINVINQIIDIAQDINERIVP